MNDNEQTLTIENWDEFIEHNDNALALLNGCGSSIADINANVSCALTMYGTDYLTTLSGFSMTVGTNTYKLDELPSLQPLMAPLEQLNDWFSKHSTKTIFTLATIEACVNQYKGMDGLNELIEDEIDIKLEIIDNLKTIGVFTALSQLLSEVPSLSALSYIIKYGPKVEVDGIPKTISREVASLFGDAMEKLIIARMNLPTTSKVGVWVNATTGALIVMGYDLIKGLIEDEGDMLPRDWLRLSVDTAESGLLYIGTIVLTDVFTEALLAAGAGSAAGPLAALGAGVVILVTKTVIDPLIDYGFGDYVVDEIPDEVDMFGNPYVIFRNGTGKKGTYDVILEYIVKDQNNSENGAISFNDKMRLYEVLSEDATLSLIPYENYDSAWANIVNDVPMYTFDEEEIVYKIVLDKITNAKSMDEVDEIVETTNRYIEKNFPHSNDIPNTIESLKSHGFDFNEYYAFTHGDYAYIANNCNDINEAMAEAINKKMVGVNSN